MAITGSIRSKTRESAPIVVSRTTFQRFMKTFFISVYNIRSLTVAISDQFS